MPLPTFCPSDTCTNSPTHQLPRGIKITRLNYSLARTRLPRHTIHGSSSNGFFVIDHKQGRATSLPRHKTVGIKKRQQFLPRSISKLVADQVSLDDSTDAQHITLRSSKSKSEGDETQIIGHAFQIKSSLLPPEFYPNVRRITDKFDRHEKLWKTSSKADATGAYFEGGCASGPGVHTASIPCSAADPKDRTNVIYEKANEFSALVERDGWMVETCVIDAMKKVFGPEFPSSEDIMNWMGLQTPVEQAVAVALQYPNNDDCDKDRKSSIFPFLSRAYRLIGWNKNHSKWRKRKAAQGGATVHCDKRDPVTTQPGVPMIYIPPENATASLDAFNLVLFQDSEGRNGLEIQTMKPGYVTVLFINSRLLHCSVFPDDFVGENNDPSVISEEGHQGLRIVCFATADQIKFMKKISGNDQDCALMLEKWKDVCNRLNGVHPGHQPVFAKVTKALFHMRAIPNEVLAEWARRGTPCNFGNRPTSRRLCWNKKYAALVDYRNGSHRNSS